MHHSTYKTTPIHWLGPKFVADAEYLKETNPRAYEHEYLGVPTGTGGNVFENVVVREIEPEEILQYDHILNGIDWSQLILFDEFGGNKLSNRETADILTKRHGITENDLLTCDSAESKSIGDYKSYGLFARAAEKGPDSRNYSFKWLASLKEIVIDPVRCPKALEEFQNYEYERDKNGDVISGYPDGNDHFIDATRYATNRIWKRRGA